MQPAKNQALHGIYRRDPKPEHPSSARPSAAIARLSRRHARAIDYLRLVFGEGSAAVVALARRVEALHTASRFDLPERAFGAMIRRLALMILQQHNNRARPIKWTYTDVGHRGPSTTSSITGHMSPSTICPHCGFHEASDETCSRCGIVFRKFHGHQETPARRLDSVLREDEVIAEFQRRRREWRNRSGFIFLVLLLLMFSPQFFHWNISPWLWLVAGVLANELVASQYRCPVCDFKMSAQGWTWRIYRDPVACPECGARLKPLSDVRKSST